MIRVNTASPNVCDVRSRFIDIMKLTFSSVVKVGCGYSEKCIKNL